MIDGSQRAIISIGVPEACGGSGSPLKKYSLPVIESLTTFFTQPISPEMCFRLDSFRGFFAT
jgi:hypothetical protein